jgi:(p)ppGpp synthase/HD superfamily hydrolase
MNHATFSSMVLAIFCRTDAERIDIAYDLAKKFHKGQTRKSEKDDNGQPLRYFSHPRRVALRLLNAGVTDANVIIAGLLHDSIEDTEEVRTVTRLIEMAFGEDVSLLIRQVTKIPKEGYLDRLSLGMERTQGRAILVKMADRLDNLATLPLDNPAFVEKQMKETKQDLMPLFNRAQSHVSRELDHSYNVLRSDIQKAVG